MMKLKKLKEIFGTYLNLNEKKAIIISLKGYYKLHKKKINFLKKTLGFNII